MSRPTTHPSNANKHPGDIVHAASRLQRQKEEIAVEKKKKQEEKEAKSAAAEQAHIKAAMQEDAMAIKQQAQLVGPPKLVRPRLRPRPRPQVPGKKCAESPTDPGDAQPSKYGVLCGVEIYSLDMDIYSCRNEVRSHSD